MKEQEQNREQKNNERPASNTTNEPAPVYLTGDSTLQTPEEDAHDKSIDLRKDSTIDVSNDDLHETNAGRFTGSDRAGSAERKDNRMNEED